MMNNEVYNFTPFTGKAASYKPRATSGQENLFVPLCETSVSSVVEKDFNTNITLCDFATLREKSLTTKKTQRKAASYEPRATSGQENLFVPLCETYVSSVVEKDFNTNITLCDFAPLREKDFNIENTKKTQRKATSGQENLFVPLCETSVNSVVEKIFFILNFLCDFAPWREKDSLRLCALAVKNSSKTKRTKNIRNRNLYLATRS